MKSSNAFFHADGILLVLPHIRPLRWVIPIPIVLGSGIQKVDFIASLPLLQSVFDIVRKIVRMRKPPRTLLQLAPFLGLELPRARNGAPVNHESRHDSEQRAENDARPIDRLGSRVHAATFVPAPRNGRQPGADEDVDEQFRRGDGGGEREHQRRDGVEGGDGAVGERVRQRAHADHHEQLQAVMLEDEG